MEGPDAEPTAGIAAASVELALEGLCSPGASTRTSPRAGHATVPAGKADEVRYRYGAFHGGPDPLADPVDAGAAVDALGDRCWMVPHCGRHCAI